MISKAAKSNSFQYSIRLSLSMFISFAASITNPSDFVSFRWEETLFNIHLWNDELS